jgi:ribonuclease P protein component
VGPTTAEGNRFPRQSRLLKPAEFKRVFDRPVVSSDRWFKVFARISEGPQSRLGMAISRKVDARAVGRNRIKRLIRESFRLNHPGCRAAGVGESRSGIEVPSRDYVVLAASAAASAANADLTNALSRHWQEIDRRLQKSAGPRDPRAAGAEEKK